MKRYLLLRENQETGPYSKEDLRAIGLVSYDLIWEERKSIRWMYPSEITELADLPVNQIARKAAVKRETKKEMPQFQEPVREALNEHTSVPVYADTLEAEKETFISRHQERKFSFQSGLSKTRGLWTVGGLMMILVGSAIIMKNIVENVDEKSYREPEASVEAISYSDDYAPVTQMDPSFQNAIVKEVVAVDTTAAKPKVKKPSVKSIKKQVSVSASDFKQGVLGGITNLMLTINNASEYKLDRVTVQVQYLKPNGEAVVTEHFDLHSIPANGTKVLEVPDSKRGVDVKYKVVSVEPILQKSSHRKA